jgi:transposase
VPEWCSLKRHLEERASIEEVSIVGLDLAKQVFQVHAAGNDGAVVLRRKLSRGQVLAFFTELPRCIVAMEACATAHYWAREIGKLGHEVRMLPPAYVKPFVKRQKMGWLPPSPDGIAMCQGRGVQRHEKERTANGRYNDRGGPGKERFPASRRDNDGAFEIS